MNGAVREELAEALGVGLEDQARAEALRVDRAAEQALAGDVSVALELVFEALDGLATATERSAHRLRVEADVREEMARSARVVADLVRSLSRSRGAA